MFKYDSTHGVFKGTIRVVDDSTLEINGKHIKVVCKRYCKLIVSICLYTSIGSL